MTVANHAHPANDPINTLIAPLRAYLLAQSLVDTNSTDEERELALDLALEQFPDVLRNDIDFVWNAPTEIQWRGPSSIGSSAAAFFGSIPGRTDFIMIQHDVRFTKDAKIHGFSLNWNDGRRIRIAAYQLDDVFHDNAAYAIIAAETALHFDRKAKAA
jgi:hypothetical protein